MKKNILILVAFLALLSGSLQSCGYNTLVEQDELVSSAWSQVENQYQRRADLIPNLVSTVKGYAAHEKSTLEGVVQARAAATSTTIDAGNMDEAALARFQQSQDALSSALSKLMVVVERYPELKANEQFIALQAQLEGTENRITTARKDFNDAAKAYNVAVRSFPRNIMAMIFGFKERPYFQSAPGSENAPVVDFGN